MLRRGILSFIENVSQLPCPPAVETSFSTERKLPLDLSDYLTKMLHSTQHNPGKEVTRFVDSFRQDIVHAISEGIFLTAAHALLSCGLYSMTGRRIPIQIPSKLSQCSIYDRVREIEIARAELVQQMKNEAHPLNLSKGL